MKILTIVVPSYNTENFIDKNMRTFLDKRLFDKTEVLIINDGSGDRTAELAGKYERQYYGYIRLINKENGGHGSVLNQGIKEAQGRYFKVIDADDWVNTENLVKLVNDLENSNADIVINPYITVDQRNQKETLRGYDDIKTIPPESDFRIIIYKGISLALHSVTYKTSILRDNGIVFTEKCFYEDIQYDLYPVPYLKTVTVCNYPVYLYLIGQKTQSVDAQNALKNIDMNYKVFCDMEKYYKENRNMYDQALDDYMKNRICIFLRSIYNVFLRNYKTKGTIEKMKEMDKKIKERSPFFYDQVGKNNGYIRLIRSKGEFVFLSTGISLNIYKRFFNN